MAGRGSPAHGGFRAELPPQEDPPVGCELIRIHHDDGRTEELHLHDYERLYAFPGVYEEIVQERLGCCSPAEIAAMLGEAIDRIGWDRGRARVLDLAAGNGVSGEALAGEGLRPVLGTDIAAGARVAALRDRPSLYGVYLTLDLLALSEPDRRTIASVAANALACVAPVGDADQHLPVRALIAAVRLLEADAVIAYMREPEPARPDVVTAGLWDQQLGSGTRAELLERRRYVHRRTVNGAPFEMEGVVWRVRRS